MPSKLQKDRAAEVLRRLRERYPEAECALKHGDPWQLLAATILSAQCTDVRVNMVTPHLFAKYPTAKSMAAANPEDVEEVVKSTGFFIQKTKSLISMSQDITDRFDGKVPERLEDLVSVS